MVASAKGRFEMYKLWARGFPEVLVQGSHQKIRWEPPQGTKHHQLFTACCLLQERVYIYLIDIGPIYSPSLNQSATIPFTSKKLPKSNNQCKGWSTLSWSWSQWVSWQYSQKNPSTPSWEKHIKATVTDVLSTWSKSAIIHPSLPITWSEEATRFTAVFSQEYLCCSMVPLATVFFHSTFNLMMEQ